MQQPLRILAYIPILKTDLTIMAYMKNVMRPTTLNYDGTLYVVPIYYNGALRWVQVRRRNYLVDESGNTLYPLISFSRTSTKRRDNTMVNKVWTFGYRNFILIENKYSKDRPFTDLDAKGGNMKKTAYFNVMLPIPMTCNYLFQVYADSHEQMNHILESFFLHDRKWWIVDGYRVKVTFSDFANTTEIEAQEDRLIKAAFSLTTESTLFPKANQPIESVVPVEPIKNIVVNSKL